MITECGVIGIYTNNFSNNDNVIQDIINGLDLMQHRGQDSCGVAYCHNGSFIEYKDYGLVKDVFNDDCIEDLEKQSIQTAIGHVRYTTSGSKIKNIDFVQPKIHNQEFAISFNGNLPDIKKIYPDVNVDTEGIVRYLSKNGDICRNIVEFQKNIPGVYCLVVLYKDELYITRDRYGLRPLNIGLSIDRRRYCVASETVVFDNLGYNLLTEVDPGQVLKIGKTDNTIETLFINNNVYETKCLFEYVYFLRPNSTFGGITAEDFRKKCGKHLALMDMDNPEFNKDNIIVTGCPNSGICSAVEYANTLGYDYRQVIKKNKNSNRTFILGSNKERIEALKNKYTLDIEQIHNKEIIIIDDSVVRGNTLNILINQVLSCKPKKIHVRIASPPVISQCYFGIDIPTKEELVYYNKNSEDKLKKHYNVDSFRYTSLEFINSVFNNKLCNSCFSGKYNNKLLEW